jgi:Protein of unknown function (DUF1577)
VVNFKERKQRFFEEFSSNEDIFNFLKTSFSSDKKLKIKFDVEDREVTISEFIEDSYHIVILTDEFYKPGDNGFFIVYGLIDRYIEFELQVLETRGPGFFECEIKSGRKASTGRADIRFKVNSDDVIATNFRISKYTLDVTMFTVPTGIKVILDQFEAQNRTFADAFEVGLLSNITDPVLADIRKTGKTLFIEDLSKDECFTPINDDFVDMKEVCGNEFTRYVMKMKEKGYVSSIIAPILYINEAEQSIPFAYISMMSKEKIYTFEDVITLKDKTFKLIDRIRDANTAFIETKQQLLDISRGGARLRIDNPELRASMLKARGFVFDIVFRLQAPITMYGEIKFTAQEPDKSILVGLSFAGSSSRKDEMKRFFEIMQPMELAYKKKLILQMRGRKV